MTKELKLGPRLLKIGEKVIGTCDDLTIEIAEATDEEIGELMAAEEITLGKWDGDYLKLERQKAPPSRL